MGFTVPELRPWSWPLSSCSYETTSLPWSQPLEKFTVLLLGFTASYTRILRGSRQGLFKKTAHLAPSENPQPPAEPFSSSIAFSSSATAKSYGLFWSFCDKVPLPGVQTHLKWLLDFPMFNLIWPMSNINTLNHHVHFKTQRGRIKNQPINTEVSHYHLRLLLGNKEAPAWWSLKAPHGVFTSLGHKWRAWVRGVGCLMLPLEGRVQVRG